jgi:LL-H family phage holin
MDLNSILGYALASVLILALTGVITFVGQALRSFLLRHLSSEQLKLLMTVARQAVLSVEQTSASASAEEKKAEAERIVQTFLDAYGIKASAKQISAAIEAAVFAELTKWSELPAAPTDAPPDPALIGGASGPFGPDVAASIADGGAA